MVDIAAKAPGCVSMGGDSTLPGCGPDTHLRWFAHASARGWSLVGAGGGRGCSDAHDQAAGFPTTLCRGLPALAG